MALRVSDSQPMERAEEVLTPAALAFVEELHQRFAGTREDLLKARAAQRDEGGEEAFGKLSLPASRLIGDRRLSEDYPDFLTIPAYELVG